MSENFNHQEYRDELADELREIRNSSELENPLIVAREHLEKEKQSNEIVPNRGPSANKYDAARNDHLRALSNMRYRKSIEDSQKFQESFLEDGKGDDYRETVGVLKMLKSSSDSYPVFLPSDLYEKIYGKDLKLDYSCKEEVDKNIDSLSPDEIKRIKDAVKIGWETSSQQNFRDERVLRRIRHNEFIGALKPEHKKELETLEQERESLLNEIKDNAVNLLECMRGALVRITRDIDPIHHDPYRNKGEKTKDAVNNYLIPSFEKYYIPLHRLNKKIARLTGEERYFQSDSDIKGVYKELSYDLSVYDEDKSVKS